MTEVSELNPLNEYIECEKCGYKVYPIFKSQEYDFIARNRCKVYAEHRPAWCNTCDDAVMAEYVPPMDELTNFLRKLELEQGVTVEENQKIRNKLEKEYGDFDELLYPDKPNELYPKFSQADYAWAKIEWRKLRLTSSRCLRCKGTEVEISEEEWGPIKHPRCGGELNLKIVVMGEKPSYKRELVDVEGLAKEEAPG